MLTAIPHRTRPRDEGGSTFALTGEHLARAPIAMPSVLRMTNFLYAPGMPPKRTKKQILEDKSRRVFEEMLPGEWVVRAIPKDYGIDTEVEIFEEAQATGLTFKVQLKSTAAIKTQIPSQSVSVSHLQYWLSPGCASHDCPLRRGR